MPTRTDGMKEFSCTGMRAWGQWQTKGGDACKKHLLHLSASQRRKDEWWWREKTCSSPVCCWAQTVVGTVWWRHRSSITKLERMLELQKGTKIKINWSKCLFSLLLSCSPLRPSTVLSGSHFQPSVRSANSFFPLLLHTYTHTTLTL